MSDPLSLVALGAAIGGAAGKVAEKAWDSAAEWLRARFASHSEATQARAKANAANFVNELARATKALEDDGRIDEEVLREAQSHPQFSLLLQQALLGAAQTDDVEKHRLLSHVVATRLASASESTLALATSMACEAVSGATHRQLHLMGLLAFLHDVRPRDSLRPGTHCAWLDAVLKPFEDVEFHEIDALHLVALGAASYDPTSERGLLLLLCMKVRIQYDEHAFDESRAYGVLDVWWREGLSGVQLTSVGLLVGGLVFDEVRGAQVGLPKWE
jgi:hypothetical protein